MSMRIFPAEQVPQGSPDWHELRRGLATTSDFKKILTPGGKLSKSATKYAAKLCADVAHLSPTWFSENALNKPPNRAMQNGTAVEPEARKWFEFEQDCSVEQVGGILSSCGRLWCSTDGIVIGDGGTFKGGLELKCPLLETQAERLIDGIGEEFNPQVHGGLVVAEGILPKWWLLSYAAGLDAILVEFQPDDYTSALRESLEGFWSMYEEALKKTGLIGRFQDQRQSILAHFPEEGVNDHAGAVPML